MAGINSRCFTGSAIGSLRHVPAKTWGDTFQTRWGCPVSPGMYQSCPGGFCQGGCVAAHRGRDRHALFLRRIAHLPQSHVIRRAPIYPTVAVQKPDEFPEGLCAAPFDHTRSAVLRFQENSLRQINAGCAAAALTGTKEISLVRRQAKSDNMAASTGKVCGERRQRRIKGRL